ncbi:DNA-binding transcriptional ArsR family regulator [Kibdelosporangium banguiense]|uniref:DNA-binding transcriptional ArsR family regulator n=1 Tax=Kibdelosporangium banguiense TaxID=1365924 RepID=A0ABS4TKS5_9PSEU|nr:helix-turn-helix domain-containing protein [Kibdelosporangium banguiense]MBP2324981.1 DNA-binding transcriptional ArsR family regulator [Kibdelosporangium banguiense]
MATLDLLLHPVRLRILRTLLDGHPATTTQLRERLPDIPPATMYRHVAALATAGVLEVLDEKRIRGAVERTYRVRWDRTELDPAAMTTDDHRRAFTAFVGGLLADFDGYLARDTPNPTADGVTYQQAALWLTDAEMAELLAEVRAAVTARIGRASSPDRTRRMISLVAMPADE